MTHAPGQEYIRTVEAFRLPASGKSRVQEDVELAVESRATLYMNGTVVREFACTPADLEALAAGYTITSGIVACIADIVELSVSDETPQDITIQTKENNKHSSHEPVGLPVDDEFTVSGEAIRTVTQDLASRQTIFPRTGGTHAAGIFDSSGRLQYFAEDVSRSNALDTAVGRALLEGTKLHQYGIALSSRLSAELVEKCARAGLRVIAAVSAPTTLAVEVAYDAGVTLCGFVREGRATVFTHPIRIRDFTGRSDCENGG